MFIHELVLRTLPRVVNLLASIHLKITKNRKKKAHGEIEISNNKNGS